VTKGINRLYTKGQPGPRTFPGYGASHVTVFLRSVTFTEGPSVTEVDTAAVLITDGNTRNY
jgi:hypothetical protein